MEKYIYEKKNVITKELCMDIIEQFDNDELINYNNKTNHKIDNYYGIYLKENKNDITKLINTLTSELTTCLSELHKQTTNVNNKYFFIDNYMFIKFIKSQNYITYSYNFNVINDQYHSAYNFIIFLNDVIEGGEVEILGKYKIKPENGKILLFPSGWCFPHSHKIPLSNHKYIIVGEIYTNFFKK